MERAGGCCPVSQFIDRACVSFGRLQKVDPRRAAGAGADCARRHDELLEGGSSDGVAAAVFHALVAAVILTVVQNRVKSACCPSTNYRCGAADLRETGP